MNKLLIILFLLISLDKAYAWGSPKKMRECSDSISAYRCDTSCRVSKDIAFNFKTNAQNNTVIFNIFLEGKLANSEALKNCQVVDADNWNCKTMDDDGISSTTIDAMTDSVYARIIEHKNSKYKSLNKFYCVK